MSNKLQRSQLINWQNELANYLIAVSKLANPGVTKSHFTYFFVWTLLLQGLALMFNFLTPAPFGIAIFFAVLGAMMFILGIYNYFTHEKTGRDELNLVETQRAGQMRAFLKHLEKEIEPSVYQTVENIYLDIVATVKATTGTEEERFEIATTLANHFIYSVLHANLKTHIDHFLKTRETKGYENHKSAKVKSLLIDQAEMQEVLQTLKIDQEQQLQLQAQTAKEVLTAVQISPHTAKRKIEGWTTQKAIPINSQTI